MNAARSAHVLLVDDDTDLLRLLSMRLTAAGHRVSTAESAEQALAVLGQVRPQLVISDVQLPGADGLALFDRIRERHPALPVILLTDQAFRRQGAAGHREQGAGAVAG
jgi:two-component system, NtrC family, response regulator GlrR